jgi:hypothetical protein
MMMPETLMAEISAFYAQQKGNKREIQDLGHLEYRMFDFIERINNKLKKEVKDAKG